MHVPGTARCIPELRHKRPCVASCYRRGMSQQVTLRLPEDLVAFMDAQVQNGRAESRAAVVVAAMERERRREVALRDALILAAGAYWDADEFDDLDG